MECALLLNIVIRKSASIFKLLACKDESLLIRRNALLVLDLLLDTLDCVRRLNIKSNSLTRQSLDKYLHAHFVLYPVRRFFFHDTNLKEIKLKNVCVDIFITLARYNVFASNSCSYTVFLGMHSPLFPWNPLLFLSSSHLCNTSDSDTGNGI